MASAVLAAYSPTIPAPMIITLVGGIPLIPPTKTPFPLFALLRCCPAISITALPAISLILRTIGLCPLASFRFSKLNAVIFFSIIFSSIFFFITARWMGEMIYWLCFSSSQSASLTGALFTITSHSKTCFLSTWIFAPASL